MKKLTALVVGVLFITSAAFIAFTPRSVMADSITTANSLSLQEELIALYTQLVQLLEQEIALATASNHASAICPVVTTPVCAANQTLVANGTDANGCNLGSTCVTNSPVSPTPVASTCPVTLIECGIGYVTQKSSGLDANGCPLPPSCVPSTNVSLTATPSSGTVPLTVSFSNVNSNSLNFGDGTGQAISDGGTIGQTSHTYTVPGTYTATSGNSSVTVTVTGSGSTMTVTASPVSGGTPHTVTFYVYNMQGSPSNYSMYFGDGSNGSAWGVTDGGNNPPVIQNHTYAAAGTYTANLENSSGTVVALVTVVVN